MEGKGRFEHAESTLVHIAGKCSAPVTFSLPNSLPGSFPFSTHEGGRSRQCLESLNRRGPCHPSRDCTNALLSLSHHRGVSHFLLSSSSAVVKGLQAEFLKWTFLQQLEKFNLQRHTLRQSRQPTNQRLVGKTGVKAWRGYPPQSAPCSWAGNLAEGLGLRPDLARKPNP